MVKELFLKDEKATNKLAKKIASSLKTGDILFLYGDLGSGKTYFTASLCEGLGVKEPVTSPSFVILNEYHGNYKIYHYDFYRLGSKEEILEVGLLDFADEGITVIEWPQLAEDLFEQEVKKIEFLYFEKGRKVILENFNPDCALED